MESDAFRATRLAVKERKHMLKLNRISKSYGQVVLNNISHTFDEGKLYVIKGISGCGKTTLLNILGGIEKEYSGEYTIDNKQLEENDNIAYIFQNSLLISTLSIRDNLLIINNDNAEIETLAQQLNVIHLLDKYPSQLSGGERQRFSIIRALLKHPKIILADEPTASLDTDNSKRIALLIAELVRENITIIVATHEECFDELADEIIYLDYGRIHNIKTNKKINKNLHTPKSFISPQKMSIFQYLKKRNVLKFSLKKALSLALVFLTLLLCVSVYENLTDEYTAKLTAKYPICVFPVETREYETLKEKYNMELLRNYTYMAEDYICVGMFEKNDSGLSYGNLIKYGKFPKTYDEVIVNQSYVKNFFRVDSYYEVIGKKIIIEDKTFYISGVLEDLRYMNRPELLTYNPYYGVDGNIVYVPYDNIKSWGQEHLTDKVMVKIENLYTTNTVDMLREDLGGSISIWDNEISTLDAVKDFVFLVVLLIVCAASLISILFITNEIELDLFYRKKEIGYLQIFGMHKKRILGALLLERLVNCFYSLIMAIVGFHLLSGLCYILFDINGFISVFLLLLFSFVVLLYILLVFYFPCRKFLKQSIIKLIK